MAEIKKINNLDEFNEFVNSSKDGNISILKVGSSWCGPCRTLESTLRGLTNEEVEGVLLGEVDIDEDWAEEVAEKQRIRGIPVIIAYKGGEEVERLVGIAPKDKLIEFFGRNK